MSKENNKKIVLYLKNEILFPNLNYNISLKKNEIEQNFLEELKKEKLSFIILPKDFSKNLKIKYYGSLVNVQNIKEEKEIISLTLKGQDRVKVFDFKKQKPLGLFYSSYEVLKEENEETEKAFLLKEEISKILQKVNKEFKILKIDKDPLMNSSNSVFIYTVSLLLNFNIEQKMVLLKENDLVEKLEFVFGVLKENINDSTRIVKELEEKLSEKLNKQKKEFYLKEQLKIIKEEIDELTGEFDDVNALRKKVENNNYPKNIKEKALKEIKRLEITPQSTPESSIIKNYLDWLLNLPYWQKDEEVLDIKKVRKDLDIQHFGLDKPKEKIIEFLAVKQNNKDSKGDILSFVGPPGTGKTSLVKSIAESLNRTFIKISLGGVKDENEIRGHRRTYIASMPGKIIQGIKKAKVINPIILLDEIDKISSDFRGDPTSALLEVLDPEQNQKFQDHFLEEDYDLSQVTFISTANYIEEIPEALRDRMEIINISSYTELEKLQIAKNYLIEKIIKETKVDKKIFKISDKIILKIIRNYTMESGVRKLSLAIKTIARKILVLQLSDELEKNFKINEETLEKFLGPKIFDFTKKNKKPLIGVTNGLAWTSYGGDILPIEVITFEGKGDLLITGQLREVMTESSKIALSFVKSNYKKFGLDKNIKDLKKFFSETDIHIHSPDGSTPKEGPSAGVTFTTSLISILKNSPMSQEIGMTGEITLNGKVLPIGGLKEKSIAAYRSGLKTIFIPKENEKDLIEIPKEVKENLKFVPVENYFEIYDFLTKNEKSLL